MAEPLTLGHVASNPLPKLRVSDESQPLEFGAFWHLGLDGLRLHQGLDGLCARTHCLCIVGLHLLQAFLVVLLGKAHVPQELGVNPLKRFVSLRPGFLDAISVPFAGLVVCGVVLGLGTAPAAPVTGREKGAAPLDGAELASKYKQHRGNPQWLLARC